MPNKNEAPGAWKEVLGYLKEKINPQSFQTWLRPTRLKEITGSTLFVEVPNREFRDWIKENYGSDVHEALRHLKLPYREVKYTFPENGSKPQPPTLAVMTRASEVKPKPVRWLWLDRIPPGKITLFAGDPDVGKTCVAIDLAARVTTASIWPDGARRSTAPGSVIVLSAEDEPEDTLVPRLMAAGADLTRVHFLKGRRGLKAGITTEITLHDIEAIQDAMVQAGDVKLVVVDPVSSYLGDINGHTNAEVRVLLSRLARLAGRRQVSIVLITHLNKGNNSAAIYRSIDSIAFVAAPRAAWLFARDKENPNRRLMLRLKGNLAKDSGGLAYELETATLPLAGKPSEIVTVRWHDGAVHVTPDSALQSDAPSEHASVLQSAKDFLLEVLKDGPIKQGEIVDRAEAERIGERTLRTAKRLLRVKSFKTKEKWWWALPGQDCKR